MNDMGKGLNCDFSVSNYLSSLYFVKYSVFEKFSPSLMLYLFIGVLNQSGLFDLKLKQNTYL